MNEETTYIYGKHVVKEALTARPDVVHTVYLTKENGDFFPELKEYSWIAKRDLNPKKLPKGIPSDAVHQNIIAEIDVKKLVIDYDEFIRTYEVTNDTAFVLLGEVQDPQNVGAVIRSGAAFGIAGVLVPEHRQAQINGTVIKVSAGMAFRVPLIKIGNVNNTIKDLKERGFWAYGLVGGAEQSVHDEQFEKPSVLILGNEATGIREKTLEHCDIPLRIPMAERAESLNAAVAAGVVLYAWSTKHKRKLS